ncbi:hypothetical protein V1512DRAFT_253911 [Lipomyces arxii]|uniref:uncharacterized protein n=1 Tax=Lipomyces arxii TaxID=56418 RepID=UPI0034CE4DE9
MTPETRSMAYHHHKGRLRPQTAARRNSPTPSSPSPARNLKPQKSVPAHKVWIEDSDDYIKQPSETEDDKENFRLNSTGTKLKREPPQTNTDDELTQKKQKHDDETKMNSDKSSHEPTQMLEEGILYFFFRPKVDVDEASSFNDVQKFYIVMRPLPSTEANSLRDAPTDNFRMMVVPKKMLPTSGGRVISLVTRVHSSNKDITEQLEAETYMTKTLGDRKLGSARPIAEGVYTLTQEGKSHYLTYTLTVPVEETDIDKEFGVFRESRYLVSARNPKYPGTGNMRISKSPEYSKAIMNEFHEYRWIPLKPAHMDYENCEILFVGSHHGVRGLNDDDADELLALEQEDEHRIDKTFGGDAAKAVFNDLHMRRQSFLDADLKGTWM